MILNAQNRSLIVAVYIVSISGLVIPTDVRRKRQKKMLSERVLLDSLICACVNLMSDEQVLEIIDEFDLDGAFNCDVRSPKPFLTDEFYERVRKTLEEAEE